MPWTNTLTGSSAFTNKEAVDYIRAREGAAAADVLRGQGKVPMNAQQHPSLKLTLFHIKNFYPGVAVKGAKYARDRSIMTSTRPSLKSKRDLGQAYLNATQDQHFSPVSRGWNAVFSCFRDAAPDDGLPKAIVKRFNKVQLDSVVSAGNRLSADQWKNLDIDQLGNMARFSAPYFCRLEDELSKCPKDADALRAVIDTGSPELKAAFMQFSRHRWEGNAIAYLTGICGIINKLDPESGHYDEGFTLNEFELCAAYHQFLSKDSDQTINLSGDDRENILAAIEENVDKIYLNTVKSAIFRLKDAEEEYEYEYKKLSSYGKQQKKQVARAWKQVLDAKKELEALKKQGKALSGDATKKVYKPLRSTFDSLWKDSLGPVRLFKNQIHSDAIAAAGYSPEHMKQIEDRVEERKNKLVKELEDLGADHKTKHRLADDVFRIWEHTPIVEKLKPGVVDRKLIEIEKAEIRAKTEVRWLVAAKNSSGTYTELRKAVLDLWRQDWIVCGGKYGKELYYDATNDSLNIVETKWHKKLYSFLFRCGAEDPQKFKNISRLIEIFLNKEFGWLKSEDGRTLLVGKMVTEQIFKPKKWYHLHRRWEKRGVDVGTFEKIDEAVVRILANVANKRYPDVTFSEATVESARMTCKVFSQGWNPLSGPKNLTNWQKKVCGAIRLERRLKTELARKGSKSLTKAFWKKFKWETLADGLNLKTLALAQKCLTDEEVLAKGRDKKVLVKGGDTEVPGKDGEDVDFSDLYQTVNLDIKCKAYADRQIRDLEARLSDQGLRTLKIDAGSREEILRAVAPGMRDAREAMSNLHQHLEEAGIGDEPELYVVFRLFQSSLNRMQQAYVKVEKLKDLDDKARAELLKSIKDHYEFAYDLAMATMPGSVRGLEDRLPAIHDLSKFKDIDSRLHEQGKFDHLDKKLGKVLPAPDELFSKKVVGLNYHAHLTKLTDAYNRGCAAADSSWQKCRPVRLLEESSDTSSVERSEAGRPIVEPSRFSVAKKSGGGLGNEDSGDLSDSSLGRLIVDLETAQTLNDRLAVAYDQARNGYLRAHRDDKVALGKLQSRKKRLAEQAIVLRNRLREANELNDRRNCNHLLNTGERSDNVARLERLRKVLKADGERLSQFRNIFKENYDDWRKLPEDKYPLNYHIDFDSMIESLDEFIEKMNLEGGTVSQDFEKSIEYVIAQIGLLRTELEQIELNARADDNADDDKDPGLNDGQKYSRRQPQPAGLVKNEIWDSKNADARPLEDDVNAAAKDDPLPQGNNPQSNAASSSAGHAQGNKPSGASGLVRETDDALEKIDAFMKETEDSDSDQESERDYLSDGSEEFDSPVPEKSPSNAGDNIIAGSYIDTGAFIDYEAGAAGKLKGGVDDPAVSVPDPKEQQVEQQPEQQPVQQQPEQQPVQQQPEQQPEQQDWRSAVKGLLAALSFLERHTQNTMKFETITAVPYRRLSVLEASQANDRANLGAGAQANLAARARAGDGRGRDDSEASDQKYSEDDSGSSGGALQGGAVQESGNWRTAADMMKAAEENDHQYIEEEPEPTQAK